MDVAHPHAGSTQTDGIWFGPAGRPLAGWLTSRPGAPSASESAVVIAPPTGYAYWCSHRPLRLLAERLAAAGHDVLRIDYDGTGDSAGDQWDADRVAAWRESLAHGGQAMRDRGATRLTLVGGRIGATLVLLDARALGADRVVAWLPPARGRRYGKEVRLLGEPVPVNHEPHGRRGTLVLAGSVFTADTVREISGLTLTDLTAAPAPAVLVVDDPAESSADAVQRLREIGTDVDHLIAADAEDALETPPEYAEDPDRLIDQIAGWVGVARAGARPVVRPPASGPVPRHGEVASIPWRDGVVHERFLRLGPEGHAAVMTEPDDVAPDAAVLVLLNSGSESHVGPGRAWVEFARDLALGGRCIVRADFVGWGESPDRDASPGRPYDAACVADALSIVQALRRDGHRRIVLGGLCAAAWIALDAARSGDVDGVLAINPQLYWRQGDPVEIDWDVIRARRADEIRRVDYGARTHLWDVLDAVGMPGRVGRWLDELVDRPARIELLFTERDDGLVFLRRRLHRHLRRLRAADRIGVHEVSEIDHPMHHSWLRAQMAGVIEQSLERIDARVRELESTVPSPAPTRAALPTPTAV